MLFDVFSDSDRHAALLLNKALSRTEKKEQFSARTICKTVTVSGLKASNELKIVLDAYNTLYGFRKNKLLPGVALNPAITHPCIEPLITKEDVAAAFYRANYTKVSDHLQQVDYVPSLNTVDLNPEMTTYVFLDDVGTPHQRETRKSPNHEGIPRKTKTVQTTNGVVLSKEGLYYLSADSSAEMCSMVRGFLFKNHLLEDRKLVVFSDGAKDIWVNIDKWFSFRPYTIFADWYHLKHKSNELFSRILSGTKKLEEDILKIKKEYFGILWTGNIKRTIDYLESIDHKYLKPGRTVQLLTDYLKNKEEHHTIAAFAVRKQLKQINASSMAETANCSMTTSKQKKQGKSWSYDGSHAKTTWRNIYANNEEENVLGHLPLHLSPVSSEKVTAKLSVIPNHELMFPATGSE